MEKSKHEQGENQRNLLEKDVNDAQFKRNVPDKSGIPIDRGWAWMTVLGCFGMHVTVMGCVKSLGVLLVEVQDRFHGVSAREMGLVLGFTITCMMGLGLAANLLAARYTCRAVVFVGGLLSFAGFVMTAFINRFWLIYLTCSLTCGVGFALSYSPCIVFVGSHFKERRSLANGLSLSGSGIGTFLLPNLMRWLLNIYGLPGCCLIIGAIELNICACALLFRPHSSYRSRTTSSVQDSRQFASIHRGTNGRAATPNPTEADLNHTEINQEDVDKNQEFADYLDSIPETYEDVNFSKEEIQETDSRELCCSVQADGKTKSSSNGVLQNQYLVSKDECEKELLSPSTDNPSTLHFSSQDLTLQCSVSHQDISSFHDQKPHKSGFDWSFLSNPVVLIYIIFAFLVNCGYPNVFLMLPAHAESIGQSRNNAALLVSVIGISDLLGRLFVGWFADLQLFERRYLFVGFTLASGVIYILLPLMTSFWGIAAFAFMYGFCSGSYVTLIAVVLADTLGKDNLGSSYGLVAMAMAAALLPSSFLCGQIRDSTGSWTYAFFSVGSIVVIGSLFPLLQPFAQRYQHRRLARSVKDTSVHEETEL